MAHTAHRNESVEGMMPWVYVCTGEDKTRAISVVRNRSGVYVIGMCLIFHNNNYNNNNNCFNHDKNNNKTKETNQKRD